MLTLCLLRGSLLGMGALTYLNPVHYSQLDPEQAEALRQRLGRARKVKLYLFLFFVIFFNFLIF